MSAQTSEIVTQCNQCPHYCIVICEKFSNQKIIAAIWKCVTSCRSNLWEKLERKSHSSNMQMCLLITNLSGPISVEYLGFTFAYCSYLWQMMQNQCGQIPKPVPLGVALKILLGLLITDDTNFIVWNHRVA